MPLPSSGALSLLGSGTGADPSGKHAMIVRMSAETLEALEDFPDHPPMDFEFGDNPGIYIGEIFFPMRPLKDTAPHELYLRLTSVTKPMAPLRLHANVIGKFTVERELGEKVTGKVRDRTLVAEKQRSERKAIMLDTPLPLAATNGKKRKAPPAPSSMFRNPIRSGGDHPNRAPSSSVPPTTLAAVPQPTEDINSPRMRLIHCLAISARSCDDVLRLVGGTNASSSYKQDLLAILQDVGEQTDPVKKGADKSNRPWRLRTKSWLEVRPYEWTKLNEAERTSVARQARLAFNDMKIPESDPAWRHVRYRNGLNINNPIGNSRGASPAIAGSSKSVSNTNTNSSTTSKVDTTPKRGVSSQDVKGKKSKSRLEGTRKTEALQMKDESWKASGVRSGKSREVEERDCMPNELAKPAIRRPGSGYKAPTLSTQDLRSGSAESNRIPRKPSTTGSTGSRPTQRKEAPSPSLPPKPAPEVLAYQEREKKKPNATGSTLQMMKKDRESIGGQGTDSEWEPGGGEGRIPKRRTESEPSGKAGLDSDRDAGGSTKRIKRGRESTRGVIEPDRERERDGGGYRPMERESGKDRGWERDRDGRDREMDRTGNKDRGQDKEARRHEQERDFDRDLDRELDQDSSAGTKRKKLARDQEEPSYDSPPKAGFQKKRKTEDGSVPVSSAASSSNKPRHLSLPKKPDITSLPPHPRHGSVIKKEPSPFPSMRHSLPSPGKTYIEPSSSSRSSKSSGLAKSRRRSPIYTSSEDEAENTRKPLTREQISVSLPPAPYPTPAIVDPHSVSDRPRPSVSDRATLRARYRSSWQDYIAIVAKVAAQKAKIEALLDSNSADSDGDVELLDAEELKKLTARHVALKDELESIQKVFENRGSGSD